MNVIWAVIVPSGSPAYDTVVSGPRCFDELRDLFGLPWDTSIEGVRLMAPVGWKMHAWYWNREGLDGR